MGGALPRPRRIAAALDDVLYRVIRLVTRPSRRLRRRLEHSAATGRLVRWMGNVVSVDGLRFSVASPAITDRARAPFVFGSYESAERRLLRRWLDPELPVVELGGSIGVIACLTNRRLRDPRAHRVVEANPALIPLLTHNRDANRCQFTIHHAAVAHDAASVDFAVGANFTASQVLAGGGDATRAAGIVQVPSTTLAALLDAAGWTECTLVCDIEGAEWALLEHEAGTLARHVRWLILELHPHPVTGAPFAPLVDRLKAIGFEPVQQIAETYAFRSARRAAPQVDGAG